MTKLIRFASGDPAVDRRVDFALMLFSEGDHKAAAEILLGALELVPGWALGWHQLGEIYEAAGDMGAAVHAWTTALALDPEDHAGATLKLALVGTGEAIRTMPPAFVEALFDQYANTFDVSLVQKLGYRIPDLLLAAIKTTGRDSFDLAADLGCGTGLMGERLRPIALRLEGYDISAEMLKKARAKGVYDCLVKADLQALDHDGPQADLVTAADVFMYIGALEKVMATASTMVAPGGLFAFSVERNAGAEDFVLQPSRRYAHSEDYVRASLEDHGFAVVSLEMETIRIDRGEPVHGLVVVAAKRPASS